MVAHFVGISYTAGSGVLHDGLNIERMAQAWSNVLRFIGIETPSCTLRGLLMYEHLRSQRS